VIVVRINSVGVATIYDERLAHRAEFGREIDEPAPVEKQPLHLAGGLVVTDVELQPGAGADEIVGERARDAGEVRVVCPLVACPVS
jgi:hypothetical protein